MANYIRGLGDGENGGNDNYVIPGRGTVDRQTLVREIESGRHPGHHTVEIGGTRYVRSNPDGTDSNNVD